MKVYKTRKRVRKNKFIPMAAPYSLKSNLTIRSYANGPYIIAVIMFVHISNLTSLYPAKYLV